MRETASGTLAHMSTEPVSLKRRSRSTNKWQQPGTSCRNPFQLYCLTHGDRRWVPCRRWRTCEGCARRLQGELVARFSRAITEAPSDLPAKFFTLTFPAGEAPEEAEAHRALRSLVRRLRHRELLTEYGWVLQRQKNSTLHYHGVGFMPWLDMDEWRELVIASGFGRIQNVQLAQPEHASYVARYVSARLAKLAPLRRAYGFSREFPQAPSTEARAERAEIAESIGMTSDCEFVPGWLA